METEKKLNLMRFWLFGTFVIIFAAITLYIGAAIGIGLMVFQLPRYWISIVVVAVLCVLTYYLYKMYLERKA